MDIKSGTRSVGVSVFGPQEVIFWCKLFSKHDLEPPKIDTTTFGLDTLKGFQIHLEFPFPHFFALSTKKAKKSSFYKKVMIY